MRQRVLLLCQMVLCATLLVSTGANAVEPEPPDRIDRVDLYVILDRSGSMSAEITAVRNNLASVVRELQCAPLGTGDPTTCIADLWAGAGTVGYAGSGSDAFRNWVDLHAAPNFAGVPTTEPGGCCLEPLTFAAHAAVTGEGGAAYGLPGVPPRSSCSGSPAANAGYTTYGYPCFRTGALPVVVLVTDEAPITDSQTYHVPNWFSVVRGQMVARGARLVGVVGDGASAATFPDLRQMATDTGAVDSAGTPVVLSGAGPNAATAIRNAVLTLTASAVPPTVAMTAPTSTFQLARDATLEWTATDGNGMGLAIHDVRYRRAAYNSGFGDPVHPSGWEGLPADTLSTTHRLGAGARYCYSVRTTDTVGHSSAWSAEACTGRPLDDRSLSVATSGWTKGSGSAYYGQTFRKTTRRGATLTLTGVQARQLALVATRCPTCGKVSVKIGSLLVGTVNLKAATRQHQRLIALPSFTYRTGKVRLTATTSGKPVVIDGLAVSRD